MNDITVKVELTAGQITNLIDFIEFEFIDSIRRDEDLDQLHSVYVDQWDWEKIVAEKDRKLSYLKKTVKKIYKVIRKIALAVEVLFEYCFAFFKSTSTPRPSKYIFEILLILSSLNLSTYFSYISKAKV